MKHLALLRGINVSGNNLIKMEELKSVLETAGFRNVKTYIQSGNVLLESENENKFSVAFQIKQEIAKNFGYDVPVIVIGINDLQFCLQKNPFLNEKENDIKKLYVAFLSKEMPTSAINELKTSQFKPDEALVDGNKIFIKYFEGAGKTKFNQKYIEKKLNVTATIRNWNTVIKLVELYQSE